MSAADKSNKLFWLAYCDLIKKQLGTDLGSTSAIFYCTRTQRGPPAGDSIDAAYTNTGLYDIGNNLLQPDNLFYNPSSQNSYIKSLLTYLGYVDLGGHPDSAALLKVKTTSEDLEAARQKLMNELNIAKADYTTMKEAGMVGDLSLAQWVVTNAPNYMAAKNQFDAATSANQIAVRDAYGPQSTQYTADQGRIQQAMYGLTYLPSINMPCTNLTPASAREILNAFNKGTPVPAPTAVYYSPDYHCAQYSSTVKDWQTFSSSEKPQEFKLTLDSGRNVKETEFGHTEMSGGLSFDYVPWVSFGASGSSTHEESSINTEDESQNIELTISYEDMKAVTIETGSWDIGDPKSTYKLKAGAPERVKLLVRPTQLALVSKLGYKVKFGAKLASQFDKKVTDTKKAGGYVRIFGIPIQVGGDFSKSTESTTHVGTWDNAAGEFTVQPTADGGFASVIALIGEKVETA